MLRPVGPVAVFCASNFPLAFSVAGGDPIRFSCRVSGVVAHHAHPGTALLIGKLIAETVREQGLPEGTFSSFGDGRTVGHFG